MGTTYSWASPEVVGHMTQAQLLMYLKTDDQAAPIDRKPANAFKSNAEKHAHVAKVRKELGIVEEE